MENATNLDEALQSLDEASESVLIDYPWILVTYRNANRPSPDSVGSALTDGELALLVDGLTDDISFDIALINLGIRRNPPARNDPPTAVEIEAAFRSFERLLDTDLIRLGRVQYVDGSPPDRVAPVQHMTEPLAQVRTRVEEACRSATDWVDWAFSCWSVNTADGDATANDWVGPRG